MPRGRNPIGIMIRRASWAVLFIFPGFAQPQPAPLKFEVASIKPADPDAKGSQIRFMPGGGLNITNLPLRAMITQAYDVRDFQISGGAGWVGTERFDITARAERAALADGPDDFAKMTDDQRKTAREQMAERLRGLLAERFQLVVHKETKEQPIYVLGLAKNGPKLKENTAPGPRQGMSMNRGRLEGFAAPMAMLGQILSQNMGRPVVDKTGLAGKYDFVLEWTPDLGPDAHAQGFGDGITSPAPAPAGPTIFTALQEQLGLRLESQKGPVENIVIDRAEKPSEN
jgi:bla regulator protein BlaR1